MAAETKARALAKPFGTGIFEGMVDSARRHGRYLLGRELGAGGMASVHLARLEGPGGFGRIVALKALHSHVARDEKFVAMLLDEARIASRIQHPNVVQVLDVVATADRVGIVLEWVRGDSLSRLVRQARSRHGEGGLPAELATRIVVDVLHGLHAAHEATAEDGSALGIVHRDVSPHNVMVGFDGRSRVVDFGVAKAAGRLQATEDGAVKGKRAYMAPEQLLGRPLDRRTDIFAVGIVAWELLTGDRLYAGESGVWNAINAVVPPWADRAPAELVAVVTRALSADPARRYDTAATMAAALEALPIAAPDEVARWVAGTTDRAPFLADAVAELESSSSPRGPLPSSTSEVTATEVPCDFATVSTTVAEAPLDRRRRRRVVSTLLVAVTSVGVLFVAASGWRAPSTVTVRARSSRTMAPRVSESTRMGAVEPNTTLVITASEEHRRPWGGAPPDQPPVPSSKPAPATSASPVCANPYWYDRDGNRHYILECLGSGS